jgi:hypothetical protein
MGLTLSSLFFTPFCEQTREGMVNRKVVFLFASVVAAVSALYAHMFPEVLEAAALMLCTPQWPFD